jgi:hypothetical protein
METAMSKMLSAFVVMSATISSVALAAEQKAMTNSELDQVVAGWYDCCYCPPPPQNEKGNNGWGNGADTTNAGSFSGGSAPSKSTNSSIPGGGINQNPTTSTGR